MLAPLPAASQVQPYRFSRSASREHRRPAIALIEPQNRIKFGRVLII